MDTIRVNKLKNWLEKKIADLGDGGITVDIEYQNGYQFSFGYFSNAEDDRPFVLDNVYDKDYNEVPCSEVFGTEYTFQEILDLASQDDVVSAYVLWDNGVHDEDFYVGNDREPED